MSQPMKNTTEDSRAFDQERSERFAERIVAALNGGALATLMSLGHRSGLFDAMSGGEARDSEGWARASGLDERYVREWLAGMLAGGVVEADGGERYSLPAEHANWLIRSSEENLAIHCQYVPMMGTVEDEVLACFRSGGGVSYDRYPRFHEVMEEDSTQTVVASLEEAILPLVPGLPQRLAAGIDVLDVGCGRGRALMTMAALYPRSRFVGMDLSAEATAYASERARSQGLGNVRFEIADLTTFDRDAEPASFDLVTAFDAVHDQAAPLALLRGIRRALRPDGVFLMQDIDASSDPRENVDHMLGPLLYAISTMHCMTVSLAQGGEGLGTMWGTQRAEAMLREAGFSDVSVERLEHDIFNAYFVARP